MSDDPSIRAQSGPTIARPNETPHSISDDDLTRTSTAAEPHEEGFKHENVEKHDPEPALPSKNEAARYAGTHDDPDFPDGGWRAWLVVFGAMCNTFSTFGFVNSWGIFQAHYQESLLRDTSPSNIAWIGSIQYSLVFLPGIFVGRLFDLGYFKAIFLTSSALLVTATFLVAQCKEYWQFLLCQGIVIGFACGGIFGPTTAVIAHWFKLRRGQAMGFVAVGSSIGGTIVPIAAKNLIPMVGFPWTMRIIGFILLFALGCSNLTLKRRLPPTKAPGGILNLRAFKSPPFTVYCLSAFFSFLGLYTVLTYVSVSALQIGVSSSLSFYLVAIANASSLFGRFTAGSLADRWGPANIMIPFTAVAGILTYAWPFARSEASLIVVVVIYGFSSGAYVSLLSNPMMELGATEDLGRRVGMFMSIFALGALAGPPISGAINTASGGFEVVGYYAGSMVMIGVIGMCLARHLVLRSLFGKF
ncbi:putative monocarboxylate [Lyophyllum shimeji]|uniref:Monocarboxylate n=1 Tax=Lyophyllum shimeji TaxID=47721 RepID=A0A9P3UIJ5_LYOSH|nr:putative monocarboxylate [Lyophyllum shimeji]